MRSILCLAITLGALSASADAAPFFLRYDADGTFPEQEGFTRRTIDPEGVLERSVADGVFTLDTRASPWISDLYFTQSEAFELADGEEFRVQWRMRTIETDVGANASDVVFAVTDSTTAIVEFFLTPDAILEPGLFDIGPVQSYPLAPDAPHTFEMRSSDMQSYALFVDGAFAFDGTFHDFAIIGPHVVAFGDAIRGLSSLSEWDFVEIAVIPEPGTVISLALGAAFPLMRRDA